MNPEMMKIMAEMNGKIDAMMGMMKKMCGPDANDNRDGMEQGNPAEKKSPLDSAFGAKPGGM